MPKINATNDVASPALPADLKQMNRRTVLAAFRDNQKHTAGDISVSTGISQLTVKRAIQFFCKNGVLESCGKGTSTENGGKKPELFRFSRMQYLMNITVWPETLILTLFDLSGKVTAGTIQSWTIPEQTEEAFSIIQVLCHKLLDQAEIDSSLLFGINFSTAGIVDYSGLTLKYNVIAPSWGTDIPIGDYLRKIFPGVECITVENTGKTISRTIMLNPKYISSRTLVLFTSWGISAAFIKNGQIQNGRDSIIGEIGHMTINPFDSEICRCGSHGCLEQQVDIRRIQRKLLLSPPPAQSPLAAIPPEQVKLRDLFDASRLGDSCAREYIRYLADCFSIMLKNVAVSFNPENIVFVGDFADADEYFEECILSAIDAFHYLPEEPFTISYDNRPLDELDASGGASILIERFFSRDSLYLDTNSQE